MKIRKVTCILTALLLSLCMFAGDWQVFGAETEMEPESGASTDYDAIQVFMDKESKPVCTFTVNDLNNMAAADGNVEYTYSAYNRNVSYKGDLLKNVKGPKVETILEAAGVDVSTLNANDMIVFTSYTRDYAVGFLASDLFADRYYFPHAGDKQYYDIYKYGGAFVSGSEAGATPVPAILMLDPENEDEDMHARIVFGQQTPNEQNFTSFVNGMVDFEYEEGETPAMGAIRVIKATKKNQPSQWKKISQIAKVSKSNNSSVDLGTEINFKGTKQKGDTFSTTAKVTNEYARNYWIAVTTDGTEPGVGSQLYVYNKACETRPIVIDKVGATTVKVKIIGHGMKDGATVTYKYKGVVPKPADFKGVSSDYQTVKLTWENNKYVEGYEVYKYNGKKYVLADTIIDGSGTYEETGLETGKTFKYKVRGYVTQGGKTTYSSYTSVKSVKTALTAPVLDEPEFEPSGETNKGTMYLQWNPVEGADGYELYRSTKKSSSYKKIATLEGNEEVLYDDYGTFKAKTTYYYKVRAYRGTGKAKAYSSYSSYKGLKVLYQ